MKPLLPLVVLLAVGIAGCSKSEPKPDPYAKYRDAQLTVGMKIADLKQQFGEPDSYHDGYSSSSHSTSMVYSEPSPEYPHHVEKLEYGPFGAHSQKWGHITKHRLSMKFIDGELYTWEKSTPVDRE